MCCADAIPICIRLLNNKNFQPGPFYLGKAGIIIGWIAVGWVTLITAVFVMPTVFPVTRGEPRLLQVSPQSRAGDRPQPACPNNSSVAACTSECRLVPRLLSMASEWPRCCYHDLTKYLCAFVNVPSASITQSPRPHAAAVAAQAQKDRSPQPASHYT